MAVIISNGATNLSTANGFYRVEDYMLNCYSSVLDLASTRTQALTFANAGNCQGIVLCVGNPLVSPNDSTDKGIKVTLQENVASVWTDRTSVTYTVSQLVASAAGYRKGYWFIPFKFADGGGAYAVDTTASKWRFQAVNSGGSVGTWTIKTQNGTIPFYAAWCDNAVSFTNNDCVIAKDVVTIDQSATFKNISATHVACAVSCRTLTPTDPYMFKWQNPPASSYTLNIDGAFFITAHGGFQCGTVANKIPYAQQAIIIVKQTPSFGTYSGFQGVDPGGTTYIDDRKGSLMLVGTPPTYPVATLAANIAVAATSFTTVESTGWLNGDTIAVGKNNRVGLGDLTEYVLNGAASGTTINTTVGMQTYQRISGGHVIRKGYYGIEFKATSTSKATMYLKHFSNFYVYGVSFQYVGFELTGTSPTSTVGTAIEETSYRSAHTISNCQCWHTGTLVNYLCPMQDGFVITNNNGWYFSPVFTTLVCNDTVSSMGLTNNLLTYSGNILLNSYGTRLGPASSSVGSVRLGLTMNGNIWENGDTTNSSAITISCSSSTITNNYFWGFLCTGSSSLSGALAMDGVYNVAMSGNTFAKNNWDIGFNNAIVGLLSQNDIFDTTYPASVKNIYPLAGTYCDMEINSSTGALSYSASDIALIAPTSRIKITDNNDTANADTVLDIYGYFVRTGTSLSDTTVRTSPGFALRMQSISSTKELYFKQEIPTGDITNKVMNVGCWCKINNAAYYAGTHQLPRLRITYDNGTVAYAQAAQSTDWQFLNVPFSPTTAYGAIFAELVTMTDATTTNAYVYWDDMNIAYPAGVAIDLGNFDIFAHGLPVSPAIATMPSLAGVWDEQMSAHTVSGSYGKKLKSALTLPQFIGLK